MKGFKVVDYISFPFPKLSWRNCINRPQEEIVLRRSGEIHRPQFQPLNCVIQLMTLGWLLAACEGPRS
jgi:hypothetical protein